MHPPARIAKVNEEALPGFSQVFRPRVSLALDSFQVESLKQRLVWEKGGAGGAHSKDRAGEAVIGF